MLKVRMIRIKTAWSIAKNKFRNSISPSARQDNLGVAIEVVTDEPVHKFLLKALDIASGNFSKANEVADEKNTVLGLAKTDVITAEQTLSVIAKQLSIVADVVDKQK